MTEKIANIVPNFKFEASDGPRCQNTEEGCSCPANFHAATVENGPRDGVCRVRNLQCSGFKG